MTWLEKYRLALKFAAIYDSEFYKDIVHDAWVRYFEKTGIDLFEAPIKDFNTYLYTVVKRSFLRFYYHERKGSKYIYFTPDDLKTGMDAPDQALFARDLYEILLQKIRVSQENNTSAKGTRLEEVFRLKATGLFQNEIAEELNLNKQVVSYYNKKIMSLVNPFNANPLKISRTITKDTWDKKTDKDDYERDDYNEYFELYKHKESGQGLLVKLSHEVKNSRGEYQIK